MGMWTFKGGEILDLQQEKFVPNREVSIEVADEADRTVELADDSLIVPGFVDAHVHLAARPFKASFPISADCLLSTGVIGCLDFGGLGYEDWKDCSLMTDLAPITVKYGIYKVPDHPMIRQRNIRLCKNISVEKMVAAYTENKDRVIGYKAILGKQTTNYTGDKEWMEYLRECADKAGCRILVHIRGAKTPIDEILDYLRPGDVISHIYQSYPGGTILKRNGEISQKLVQAVHDGLLVDSGVGMQDFSFKIFKQAHEIGLDPTFISTDAVIRDWHTSPELDFVDTVTKFIVAGMDRDKAFLAGTKVPADFLGVKLDYAKTLLVIEKEKTPTTFVDNSLSGSMTVQSDYRYATRSFVHQNKLVFDYPYKNS